MKTILSRNTANSTSLIINSMFKPVLQLLLRTSLFLLLVLSAITSPVQASETVRVGYFDKKPVAANLTGWTIEEAKDKPLVEVFHIVNALTKEPAVNPVYQVLENGEIVGLANHTMLIARDGAKYQIADSTAPIRDDDGKVTGVVLVFRDVTKEYRMGEDLRGHFANAGKNGFFG